MLTLFTTSKPFLGHAGIIQRNALQSWKHLHSEVEVIVFGDEEGVADVCAEFGLRHEARVERDPSGLKYIHAMFDRADEIARYDVLCYVNCDIILGPDFPDAVQRVRAAHAKFLMVGRRWDTDIVEPIDFSSRLWHEETRALALKANNQRDDWWIDYFCFSRDLYYKQIPPFVIGRIRWDNWLIWKALDSHVPVVNASSSVLAIHQNHNYAYHPEGKVGVWTDELSQRNLSLAGGRRHLRKIADATIRLTPEGLKPNWARHWHRAKRDLLSITHAFIFGTWMPAWHFLLGLTRPVRARLGLRSKPSSQASRGERPLSGHAPFDGLVSSGTLTKGAAESEKPSGARRRSG